MYNTLM
jgi:tRNA-2-methylthio-N6-dimethylallyladenosine synthase